MTVGPDLPSPQPRFIHAKPGFEVQPLRSPSGALGPRIPRSRTPPSLATNCGGAPASTGRSSASSSRRRGSPEAVRLTRQARVGPGERKTGPEPGSRPGYWKGGAPRKGFWARGKGIGKIHKRSRFLAERLLRSAIMCIDFGNLSRN